MICIKLIYSFLLSLDFFPFDGGAKIDTAGHAVSASATIDPDAESTGGLLAFGGGSLALAAGSTYAGATTVPTMHKWTLNAGKTWSELRGSETVAADEVVKITVTDPTAVRNATAILIINYSSTVM